MIHSDASAETLGLLRIWVFGVAAARVARMPIEELGRLPATGFQPFGILGLVPDGVWDAVLSPSPLAALKIGLVVVLLAAAAGVAPRTSTALGAVGLMVAEAVARGYSGHVNHAQLPLIYLALIVAASPSGDALALWNRGRGARKPKAYQLALVAAVVAVSASYLFIGSYRMARGVPEVFTSNSLAEWILWWNLDLIDPAATLGVQAISNPLTAALLRLSFPLITLLEISAPLCLFSRRFRLFFIPAMLATHFGIYLLMTIDFVDEALLYLVFIDSRHWSPTRRREGVTRVVFFDGFCGLCNRFVDFALGRDRDRRFRFSPLQGATAAERLQGVNAADPATIVFLDEDGSAERSTAVLRIMGRLGGPWSLATFLLLIPRPVRDTVYDWVARHRFRWFGRRDSCRLPTPEERAFFLP